ncbi:MAG: flagellar assembly protein FliW [Lachnospiraceae bacterium]|nr:flagellar assembly protein FliW [Lachnospiraceae bacterium]MCM1239623.1 flagellar assembly protein FliW [Lachnospiraceae bacterium]MCM1302727.1 flagellar assembly protein FliW [Butyrivibrio sp.]MCM1342447.1 flagellar assembly protein FliW [Muribaculaceae bacterium]MCM1410247.1 flagellar assembly protein FliW [Lachnospiraceae bacterium]
MKINTRLFGEIEISEDKIITFENGIIGFPDMKRFALIHDEDVGQSAGIRYMQSLDEAGFAMPVMDPLIVKPDYDPEVEDELLAGLGSAAEDGFLVMVTVSVPSDLTKMSVNLRGPLVINVETHKACQVIVDSNDFPVKFPIYEILQGGKAGV